MRLLLDTHVLLWWLADDATLAPSLKELISRSDVAVWISAATAWELSIKQALGKLTLPGSLADALVESQFEPLAITLAHGLRAGALPRHHDDPFDRMLIAQAQIENLTLVTRDEHASRYEVSLLRA